MPVQTPIVIDQPHAPSRHTGPTASGEGFVHILAGWQATQLASITAVLAQRSGVERPFGERLSSPAAERVARETADARQAADQGGRHRHADPTSVERGVLSGRHERLLAEQQSLRGTRTVATPKASSPPPPSADAIPAKTATPPRAMPPSVDPKPADGQTPPRTGAEASRTSDPATAPTTRPGQVAANTLVASPATQPAAQVARSVGQLLAQPQAVAGTSGATSSGSGSMTADAQHGSPRATRAQRSPAGSTKAAARGDKPLAEPRTSAFQKLVGQVRLNRGTGRASATLRLDPPRLGRMRIDVRMVNERLAVRVEASTPAARDLLQGRAEELVSALRDQRIDVQRFEVVHVEGAVEHDDVATKDDEHHEAAHTGHPPDRATDAGQGAGAPGADTDMDTDTVMEAIAGEVAAETRLDLRV
jgi:flagellar hook-length control protein FliK